MNTDSFLNSVQSMVIVPNTGKLTLGVWQLGTSCTKIIRGQLSSVIIYASCYTLLYFNIFFYCETCVFILYILF